MLGHLRNVIEQPLRAEIDKLRHTILELARDPQLVYDALQKGMGEAEPWLWQRQAVEAIIRRMTAGPLVKLPARGIYRHMPGVITMGHARVPCPLCGRGREPFTNREDEADDVGTYMCRLGWNAIWKAMVRVYGSAQSWPLRAIWRGMRGKESRRYLRRPQIRTTGRLVCNQILCALPACENLHRA
jgi:hypothetical protein